MPNVASVGPGVKGAAGRGCGGFLGAGAELWSIGVGVGGGQHPERGEEPGKQDRGGQRRQAHWYGWSQDWEVTRHSLLVPARTLEIIWSRPTFEGHSDPHG